MALPGYIVMRIGAQWIYSEAGWDDLPDDAIPAWIGIGFIVADLGALLVLIALIVGGIGVRRLRDGKGTGLLKAAMVHRLDRARRSSRRRVGHGRQARLNFGLAQLPSESRRMRPAGHAARRAVESCI